MTIMMFYSMEYFQRRNYVSQARLFTQCNLNGNTWWNCTGIFIYRCWWWTKDVKGGVGYLFYLIVTYETYNMGVLKVNCKIVYNDVKVLVFPLGTEDVIKLGLIETIDISSLIALFKIYKNGKLDFSINGISKICNCKWQAWCFTWYNFTGTITWSCHGIFI